MDENIRRKLVDSYVKNIKSANNEQAKKERFVQLLTTLFNSCSNSDIIDQFTTGAETYIKHIQRKNVISSGRADTQYGSIIIEFEHDLSKTGIHAEEQLKEYLSGNLNNNIHLNFTLIATDCLRWRVYTPSYDSLLNLGFINPKDITLEKKEELNLVDIVDDTKAISQANQFYFFLDRFLFQQTPLPATLEEIRKSFGYGSEVFQIATRLLHAHFVSVRNTPAMQTAYAQWHKFLSVAYGRFEASERAFLTQSYLSILAKMLAYTVVSGDDFIDDHLCPVKEVALVGQNH